MEEPQDRSGLPAMQAFSERAKSPSSAPQYFEISRPAPQKREQVPYIKFDEPQSIH
jgi:hypothetical protein